VVRGTVALYYENNMKRT